MLSFSLCRSGRIVAPNKVAVLPETTRYDVSIHVGWTSEGFRDVLVLQVEL